MVPIAANVLGILAFQIVFQKKKNETLLHF